jgi:hypothetical protein
LIVVNPGFITHDDPLQKVVTFFAIMNQVAKTIYAHGFMLFHQFLRYPPGIHFMDLKVIRHHRIGRTQC